MEVFFLLFLWLTIVEIILKKISHTPKIRAIQSISYGIATALPLALRSPQNGTDLKAYCPSFLQLSDYSLTELFHIQWLNFEKGYVIYNKLVSYITADVQGFLAITAFITIGLITWIIYKYSKNIYLSFIIFICFGLYFMCFSGLRQAIAFAITFVSYHFIVEKKRFLFISTVLLASTFHTSALVFLIAWFISNLRLSPKLATASLLTFFIFVLPFLRLFVSTLVNFVFPGRYTSYANEGGATTLAIVYTLMFIGSYLIVKDSPESLNRFRWMILITVLCQWLGYISTGSMTRIGYYYSIFFCLYIPEIMEYVPRKFRQMSNFILVILFILFFLFTSHNIYIDVDTYHFYWEPGYQFWL